MLKLAIMIERRQRMHKWTHYERMMNMDLFVQPPVIVDKNGGEFKLDYRSIIIGTLKTYDFTKDKVYGRGPFAHIPQAFLDNKYVSTYIEIATDLFDKSEEAGLLPKEQEASYTDGDWWSEHADIDPKEKYFSLNCQRYIATEIRSLYHCFNLYRSGERVMKVSDGLYSALGKSDYPAVMEMVKPPFREFYMLLPTTQEVITMPNVDVPIEGMYVNLEDMTDGKKRLAVLVTERPRTIAQVGSEEVYFFEAYFKPDQVVDEAIEYAVKQMRPDSKYDERYDHVVKEQIKPIIVLIFKVLLYMDSHNASIVYKKNETKLPDEKRMRKFPHRTKSTMDYAELGGDIIIDPNRHKYETNNTGLGSQHQYRYEVRGHWHAYWVKNIDNYPDIGNHQILDTKEDEWGNTWYKIIQYLKPYYKGPEYADVVKKDYRLKEVVEDD